MFIAEHQNLLAYKITKNLKPKNENEKYLNKDNSQIK